MSKHEASKSDSHVSSTRYGSKVYQDEEDPKPVFDLTVDLRPVKRSNPYVGMDADFLRELRCDYGESEEEWEDFEIYPTKQEEEEIEELADMVKHESELEEFFPRLNFWEAAEVVSSLPATIDHIPSAPDRPREARWMYLPETDHAIPLEQSDYDEMYEMESVEEEELCESTVQNGDGEEWRSKPLLHELPMWMVHYDIEDSDTESEQEEVEDEGNDVYELQVMQPSTSEEKREREPSPIEEPSSSGIAYIRSPSREESEEPSSLGSPLVSSTVTSTFSTKIRLRRDGNSYIVAEQQEFIEMEEMAEWEKILAQLPFGSSHTNGPFICVDKARGKRYKVREFLAPETIDGVVHMRQLFYYKVVEEDGQTVDSDYTLAKGSRLRALFAEVGKTGSFDAPIDLE
ncbi:hypothetical protein QR680_012101 [Steinernema hermaphroditum]|uniref:Uncharacterized protein n=1 Tax=Steinernema hermaphroditum TaxID=289476 RepID=A0AA39LZA0_9BILA|nr:hypothetical protein QR680_012101 [Steinernema hermaphroditum]